MNKKVNNIFLALSIIVLFSSCNKPELGNIEILEQNTTTRFKTLKLYLHDFRSLGIEADIVLRNKVTNKDSIAFENIIANDSTGYKLIIKEFDRETIIWNQIFLVIEDLTTIKISDINSSKYVLISGTKNKEKIDLYISFRDTQPEFNVGHKNDVSY